MSRKNSQGAGSGSSLRACAPALRRPGMPTFSGRRTVIAPRGMSCGSHPLPTTHTRTSTPVCAIRVSWAAASSAGRAPSVSKIAEKPAKGKAAKQHRWPDKSADSGIRKAPLKGAGSGQGFRAGLGVPRPAKQGTPAKAKPASAGNMRQLRPRKPVHDGWGPFYDLAGTAELLGISRAEAEEQGEISELLMMSTTDGRLLFPVWRFTGQHSNNRVAKVVAVFRDLHASPWLVVQWATAPNPPSPSGSCLGLRLCRLQTCDSFLHGLWRRAVRCTVCMSNAGAAGTSPASEKPLERVTRS